MVQVKTGPCVNAPRWSNRWADVEQSPRLCTRYSLHEERTWKHRTNAHWKKKNQRLIFLVWQEAVLDSTWMQLYPPGHPAKLPGICWETQQPPVDGAAMTQAGAAPVTCRCTAECALWAQEAPLSTRDRRTHRASRAAQNPVRSIKEETGSLLFVCFVLLRQGSSMKQS